MKRRERSHLRPSPHDQTISTSEERRCESSSYLCHQIIKLSIPRLLVQRWNVPGLRAICLCRRWMIIYSAARLKNTWPHQIYCLRFHLTATDRPGRAVRTGHASHQHDVTRAQRHTHLLLHPSLLPLMYPAIWKQFWPTSVWKIYLFCILYTRYAHSKLVVEGWQFRKWINILLLREINQSPRKNNDHTSSQQSSAMQKCDFYLSVCNEKWIIKVNVIQFTHTAIKTVEVPGCVNHKAHRSDRIVSRFLFSCK